MLPDLLFQIFRSEDISLTRKLFLLRNIVVDYCGLKPLISVDSTCILLLCEDTRKELV